MINKLNKILLAGIIIINFNACAQEKKENMENISKELEQKFIFKQESYNYQLSYEHTSCSFEILINDIPVVSHFVPNSMYISAQINPMILSSGKQKITIRMYPQKIDENTFKDKIDENAKVKFKITKDKRNADPMWAWSEEAKNTTWDILKYETPKIDKGISYQEYTTEFNLNESDVNWKLKGWQDSQTLKDTPLLRKEVEDFYNQLATIINNKDSVKYITLRKQQILEEANCYPHDKNGVKDIIASLSKSIEIEQERLFILDPHKTALKFYADNKVVSLVCIDPKFFGYPPLISQGKDERYASGFVVYLHKPKGSDKLEIIR